jgi:hypothetical protein
MSPTSKQVAATILAAGLAGLGLYGWSTGTADRRLLWMIAIGVVLAIIYVARGGSLPDVIHRYGDIGRDDDPVNIPLRVYLPLILLALTTAAVLIWLALRR